MRLVLCRRWPARLTKTMLSLALLTFMLMSCTPAPKPTPQVRLGGNKLHFPLVMAAPYRWQATGYGRPWQSIGRDPELHRRGMWAYSWGLGACLYDIPMQFDGHDLPSVDMFARCNATSDVLLLFNEPEYKTQANTDPATAAKVLRGIEQNWRGEIWCCGILSSHAGWLDRMLTAYRDEFGEMPRLAGTHLHIYVNDGFGVDAPDDGRWLERSQAELATYLAVVRKWQLPARIVVSECCLLGKHTQAEYLAVMNSYAEWLRSVSEVVSVAWFSARDPSFADANLLRSGGRLTVLGERWLELRWE